MRSEFIPSDLVHIYDINFIKQLKIICICFQFSQNEKLKEKLLLTYPKTLVEARKESVIWGIGLDEGDPRALKKQTWLGKNLLGKILTEVRERLRNDIENVSSDGNQSDL